MSRALPYVPVEELKGRPHVLVDGAARPGSVLTLSHWPQSPTPPALARDLSAQIVFAFLHATRGEVAPGDGAPGRGGRGRSGGVGIRSAIAAVSRAEAVTNDHFDEDGVVSVFSMAEPDVALRHEGCLSRWPPAAISASCGPARRRGSLLRSVRSGSRPSRPLSRAASGSGRAAGPGPATAPCSSGRSS